MDMRTILLCTVLIGVIAGTFGCENLPIILPSEDVNLRVNASLDRQEYNVGDRAQVIMISYLEEYSTPVETKIAVNANGQPLKTYDITLQPGQNVLTDSWGPFTDSQVADYEISFTIDPDDLISETNEDDNSYSINAAIRASTPPTPCQNECGAVGMVVCTGDNTYKSCGQFDADSCYDLGTQTQCPTGQVCSGSGCHSQPCTNECGFSGMQVCSGNNTFNLCGNYDADACLDIGPAGTCPPGQTCSGTGCHS